MAEYIANDEFRSEISTLGSFLSVPDAFPGVDSEVKNVVKFEFKTVFSDDNEVQTLLSTDLALIDIAAVDPEKLDYKKMAVDCDLIKEIVEKHPDELKECLIALQAGDALGVQKAEEITKRIGLTEAAFVEAGGGFFWLIIPIIIAATAGCGASNKIKNNKTTPTSHKNPRPDSDAGPDAGG